MGVGYVPLRLAQNGIKSNEHTERPCRAQRGLHLCFLGTLWGLAILLNLHVRGVFWFCTCTESLLDTIGLLSLSIAQPSNASLCIFYLPLLDCTLISLAEASLSPFVGEVLFFSEPVKPSYTSWDEGDNLRDCFSSTDDSNHL